MLVILNGYGFIYCSTVYYKNFSCYVQNKGFLQKIFRKDLVIYSNTVDKTRPDKYCVYHLFFGSENSYVI